MLSLNLLGKLVIYSHNISKMRKNTKVKINLIGFFCGWGNISYYLETISNKNIFFECKMKDFSFLFKFIAAWKFLD
jgi:hypothetical protein